MMLVIDRAKTGQKINELIKKSGLKKWYVAEKLFISQQNISYWISGRNLPDVQNLANLAKILNCTVDDILQTKGEI